MADYEIPVLKGVEYTPEGAIIVAQNPTIVRIKKLENRILQLENLLKEKSYCEKI